MPQLELTVASNEPDLSVRRFSIRESVSTLYSISVMFRTPNLDVNLEAIVGRPASLRLVSAYKHVRLGGSRLWTGICNHIQQVQSEDLGLSTYSLSIVPVLWTLTQKRDYRIFQHISIPDIIDKVLEKWNIEPTWQIDRGRYPKLEYKVQYDETDFAFFSRLLEEAGIAFVLTNGDDEGSKLVLSDKLEKNPLRTPLLYVDNPTQAAEREFVARVRLGQEVRPGAMTMRDYDFRRPAYPLFGDSKAGASEAKYEQYHYEPGGFLVETGRGGGTPAADDKGIARHDEGAGKGRAARALLARRSDARSVAFETNAIDVTPGTVFSMLSHPHSALTEGTNVLVTDFAADGTHDSEWTMSGRAVFAANEFRPQQKTEKPVITSMQTAVVVGPDGQEIHTDEFGRVRVQFQWDRLGRKTDDSSCWIRVSQGWAGKGYGMISLPRIGHEVVVGFLAGDPDQPIVIGRMFNAIVPVIRKLPDHKTQSVWRSDSSLGSGGASEITFDDDKGNELVHIVAHKNLRRLVKNDETITVGRHRTKDVSLNETDTTTLNRTEITILNRTETVNTDKITYIQADRRKLINGDEYHVTDGNRMLHVIKDQDLITGQVRRERIVEDDHLVVVGNLNEQVGKSQSIIIEEDQFEKVGKSHALETGKDLNVRSGGELVGEGASGMTMKGPGGFIRIDSAGITIVGKMVRVNAGGSSARKGRGAQPKEAEKAKQREPDKAKNEDGGAPPS